MDRYAKLWVSLLLLGLARPALAQPRAAGIWQAAYAGDVAAVQRTLDANPGQVNRPDRDHGATPLHWAAAGGRVEVVKLLLARGADAEAANSAGMTPLHNAAYVGADEVAAALLATGGAVAPRDSAGRSPLDLAVERQQSRLVERLSRAEDEVRRQLQAAQAPVQSVWLEALPAAEGPQAPIKAADPAWPDAPVKLGGQTYVHGLWSHDRDSQYTVRLNGRGTRLSLAAGVVDSNGEHGRLRFYVQVDGKLRADTGIMLGKQPPKLLTVDLRGAKSVTVLVDTGGDGNWANAGLGGCLLAVTADEALHVAALAGQTAEVARLAAAQPERVAQIDELCGLWPLAAAAIGGQAAAAQVLVQHGADPNQRGADGSTGYHEAVLRGQPRAIGILGRVGGDPTIRNRAGVTAHDLALQARAVQSLSALTEVELWFGGEHQRRSLPQPTRPDGRAAWVSPAMVGGRPPLPVHVQIGGWRDLYLLVDDVDGNPWDHADLAMARLVTADGQVTYLDEIEPVEARQGADAFHRDGHNLAGHPLRIGSQQFERGLATHAAATLHYVLTRDYAWFDALVGVDASAGTNGLVRFVVTDSPAKRADGSADTRSAPYLQHVGTHALTFTDLSGRLVSLADWRGKVVVLVAYVAMPWNRDFRYTWLDYADELARSKAAAEGRLVVVAVTPDSPAETRAFLKEHGYSFDVLFDHDDTLRRRLGLNGLPAVVLDRKGRLAWQRRMWQCDRIEPGGLFIAVDRVLDDRATSRPEAPPVTGPQVERSVVDFEHGYGDWQRSGDCFDAEPASDAAYPGLIAGYTGRRFLSTRGAGGRRATGVAWSPPFALTARYLHCLVGGGDLPDHTCVTLVVDGRAVRRASGMNTAELAPVCWDLQSYRGKQARLEVLDSGSSEPRDFVLLDDVTLSEDVRPPAHYARRYEPDTATPATDDWPAHIRAFCEGRVHQDAIPGRTYRLEWQAPVSWGPEPVDWLLYALTCPQDHLAQTVRRMACTVASERGQWPCEVVATSSPMYPKAFCAFIPALSLPTRRGTVSFSCDVTANTVDLVEGPPPDPPGDLLPAVRASLTAPVPPFYDYAQPAVSRYLDEHHLRRRTNETDAAFLFRAYRFLQRSFVYGNVKWAGHPLQTTDAGPSLGSLQTRTSDCGMAHLLALMLRANGIPAAAGQGGWVPEDGRMGGHVRLLSFLRDAGWLWMDVGPETDSPNGWFAPGTRWDDNFLQFYWEDPAGWDSALRPPRPGQVLRGYAGEWPVCHLLKRPDVVPLSPCADTDPVLWRGTNQQPPAGWAQPGFDDRGWTEAPGGFGPLSVPTRRVRSEWTTAELWLRRTVTIAPGQVTAPRLRVSHDGDCEVYVNGHLAVRLSGGRGDYGMFALSTEARRALRPGRATLAVHCRRPNWPGFIDVGLVDVRP